MCLQGIGRPQSSIQQLFLIHNQDSLWTIHLAYLFKHYGIDDFTYYTSYIGVNWQHASKLFYKNSMAEMKQIHALFSKAQEKGVRVIPLVLSLDHIRRFLSSNRYAVIILVNLNDLSCIECFKAKKRTWRDFFGLTPKEFNDKRQKMVDTTDIPDSPPLSAYSSLTALSPLSLPTTPPRIPSAPTSRQTSPIHLSSSLSLKSPALSSLSLKSPTRTLSFPSMTASKSPQSTSLPRGMPRHTPNASNDSSPASSPKKQKAVSTHRETPIPESGCFVCNPFSKLSKVGYSRVPDVEFIGHYIILIGYNSETDIFYYRDPGTSSTLCQINGGDLEKARNSPGTDHDLIVVKLF